MDPVGSKQSKVASVFEVISALMSLTRHRFLCPFLRRPSPILGGKAKGILTELGHKLFSTAFSSISKPTL